MRFGDFNPADLSRPLQQVLAPHRAGGPVVLADFGLTDRSVQLAKGVRTAYAFRTRRARTVEQFALDHHFGSLQEFKHVYALILLFWYCKHLPLMTVEEVLDNMYNSVCDAFKDSAADTRELIVHHMPPTTRTSRGNILSYLCGFRSRWLLSTFDPFIAAPP